MANHEGLAPMFSRKVNRRFDPFILILTLRLWRRKYKRGGRHDRTVVGLSHWGRYKP